jgi:predicted nucleotidyltransferase
MPLCQHDDSNMVDVANDNSKLLIRLPASLHRELKARAAISQKTLNEFCLEGLRSNLSPSAAAISTIAEETAVILRSSLARKLEAILLFGSRAREDAWQGSDTDLLLCLPRGTQLNRDLYREWDALVDQSGGRMAPSTSPHFAVLPDSVDQAGGLWFEVAIDGIMLWDRRFEVSRFLGQVRRFLLAGKAVRKATYGVPYWVRTDAEPKAG